MTVKNDLKYISGESSDEIVKNLFKILCGCMGMPLKQRGHNMMDDRVLLQFLDTINFDILDDDLILLNQLSTIKSLSNRPTFSITDIQGELIHDKFQNLCEQRHKYLGNQKKNPSKNERKERSHNRTS